MTGRSSPLVAGAARRRRGEARRWLVLLGAVVVSWIVFNWAARSTALDGMFACAAALVFGAAMHRYGWADGYLAGAARSAFGASASSSEEAPSG